jgi:WD40 repeat protein
VDARQKALPAPWLDGPVDIDVPALLARLDAADADPAHGELAMALRHAAARMSDAESAFLERRMPHHVLRGQTVLDIAVEWRMPAVERWAVAWLAAATVPYLRTRWSSRSRDGRQRRDRRAPGGVVHAMAGTGDGAVTGTQDGTVSAWSIDGEITPRARLGTSAHGTAVRAVSAHGGRIVAGGTNGAFVASGWAAGTAPPDPPQGAAIVSVGLDAGDAICCGTEDGRVYVWRPGGAWAELPHRTPHRVSAVAVRDGVVRAVWRDGSGATAGVPDGAGIGRWADEFSLGTKVDVAAWDVRADRLAYSLSGEDVVRVTGLPDSVWQHTGVQQLAWSPGGVLASAGRDHRIRAGLPGRDPTPMVINSEARITALAFAGDRHVVSAHHDRLVQWDLSLSGSEDPTFEANDEITAVALNDGDRGYCVIGTRLGILQQYDARGLFVHWRPAIVPGTVHQLVHHRGHWLVACQNGAFRWAPGTPARQLYAGLCRAVASWRGHAVYAAADEVRDTDGRLVMRLPRTVVSLAAGSDGTLAAMAVDGTLGVLGVAGTDPWQKPTVPGDRLLATTPTGALTVNTRDGLLRAWSPAGSRRFLHLSIIPTRLVYLDAARLAGAYPRGTAVIEPNRSAPGPPTATVVAAVPTGSALVAAAAGRVVTADGLRLTGYDIMEQNGAAGMDEGTVRLDIAGDEHSCVVSVAGVHRVTLRRSDLGDLGRKAAGHDIAAQSEAIDIAGRLGDQLWFGGLDGEIDRARGRVPDRPVRLELMIRGDRSDELADVPWELLHPRTAPLCWFDDPPITMVRLVPSGPQMGSGRSASRGRPRMLVLRDAAPELDVVDAAYEEIRRRTRHTAISLASGAPVTVTGEKELRAALQPADVIHLWAHSTPTEVHFSSGSVGNDTVAAAIAAAGARFVVLVGCASAALARRLVHSGVDAVVGMRTTVYNQTVQPLVENLTAAVLRGTPVDLAFADALKRYILSGQPGAAAVPLLHLREGSTGTTFPADLPWRPR